MVKKLWFDAIFEFSNKVSFPLEGPKIGIPLYHDQYTGMYGMILSFGMPLFRYNDKK